MDRTQFTNIFIRDYIRSTSLGIFITLVVCVIREVDYIVYLPYTFSAVVCFTYQRVGKLSALEQKHRPVIISLILGYTLTFYLYYLLGGHFLFSSLATVNILLTLMEFGVLWSSITYILSIVICFNIDLITSGSNPFKLQGFSEFSIRSAFFYLSLIHI